MRTIELGVLFTTILTTACVTGPVDGNEYVADIQDLQSPKIAVGGFVRDPGARIALEGGDGRSFKPIGPHIVASEKATFPEGAFCKNSPALFAFHDPNFAGFHWPFNTTWQDTSEPGLSSMTIRAHQVDGPNAGIGLFFTDRHDSIECMLEHLGVSDCDFYDVATSCGYNLNQATIFMRSP